MSETRTAHDPFAGRDVQISDRLVDRLRGKYAVGQILANGEPEFGWREYPVSPINGEAADRIEALEGVLREIIRLRLATSEGSLRVRADRMWDIAREALKQTA